MQSFVKNIIGLFVLLLLTGCGAMFQGTTKTIGIQSSPAGAIVTSQPGIGEYTTPTSVTLSRKHSYDLTFKKDGYKPKTAHIRTSAKFGYILLDVLFTGLVGVVVDAATGGWNELSPDNVIVTLEKEDMSMKGPEQIDISLSNKDSEIFLSSDHDPIKVQIDIIER